MDIRKNSWPISRHGSLLRVRRPDVNLEDKNSAKEIENLLKYVFLDAYSSLPTVIVLERWNEEEGVHFDVLLGSNTIVAALEVYDVCDRDKESPLEIDGVPLHLLQRREKNKMIDKWVNVIILNWDTTSEDTENFVNAFRGGFS